MTDGSFAGGVVPEMHQLATTFSKEANSIAQTIRNLDHKMGDSDRIWKGQAADQFRTEWHEAKTTFEKMRQALEMASRDINRHAENIRTATSAHGR